MSTRPSTYPINLEKRYRPTVPSVLFAQKDKQHGEKLQRLLHRHNSLQRVWLHGFVRLVRKKSSLNDIRACLQFSELGAVYN